jgi:hypothetical protein
MIREVLALLAMGGLGIVPPPLPEATAPPLKEIGHVVSTPFCAMLSEKARPAIAGLMLNDGLTDYAGPVIARYYRDEYANNSTAADFDIIRLRDVAMHIAHNLLTVDAILATVPKPTSATPTAAERATEDLRAKLNAVQDAQRETLNVVSGLAETEAMSEFQKRPNPLQGAVDGDMGQTGASTNNVHLPEGWAGLAPTAADNGDPRVLLKGMMLGANATTPYMDALSSSRSKVRLREGTASDAILKMAASCNPAQASPAPSSKP